MTTPVTVWAGTLSGRFAAKELLIDAIFEGRLNEYLRVAERALEHEDAPNLWRRHLTLIIDGLRNQTPSELGEPPLTPAQLRSAVSAARERAARATGGPTHARTSRAEAPEKRDDKLSERPSDFPAP